MKYSSNGTLKCNTRVGNTFRWTPSNMKTGVSSLSLKRSAFPFLFIYLSNWNSSNVNNV